MTRRLTHVRPAKRDEWMDYADDGTNWLCQTSFVLMKLEMAQMEEFLALNK